MASSCEVQVRHLPGAAVFVLHGEIDISAGPPLDAAYLQASGGTGSRLVLDFADVDYINSIGIALIVGILARARTEGRSVVAAGLSEHYRKIFEITRLSDFIELVGAVDEAVAAGAVPQIHPEEGAP